MYQILSIPVRGVVSLVFLKSLRGGNRNIFPILQIKRTGLGELWQSLTVLQVVSRKWGSQPWLSLSPSALNHSVTGLWSHWPWSMQENLYRCLGFTFSFCKVLLIYLK